ncbi:hypothetical protein HPB48_013380 [Haemaphysalis longicornis]|uniref:Peptidase M13 N-terminal domain-containing protein n=1 Tax=Haemaphysalis longicornis TaxID=44386 RepID=A0A9J6GZV1_HAELO|nr:hypothetical protein HPB48_013380 [Haemaphysalis longicornis]
MSAAAMSLPLGTEPFSLSTESPRTGDPSTSSGPVLLSRGSRKLGEASVLVSKNSGSSAQPTTPDTDRQHQTSSTVIFFATVCLLLFATLLTAYVNARRIQTADLIIGCRTAECKLASGYLSTLMDRDVDPCDDFYQHVCAKWTKDRDGVSFLGDTFQQFLADLRRRLTTAALSSVSPNLQRLLLAGKHFVQECIQYMDDPGPGIKVEVHSLLDALNVTTILKSETTFDAVLHALTLSFTTGLAAVVEIRRRRLAWPGLPSHTERATHSRRTAAGGCGPHD